VSGCPELLFAKSGNPSPTLPKLLHGNLQEEKLVTASKTKGEGGINQVDLKKKNFNNSKDK